MTSTPSVDSDASEAPRSPFRVGLGWLALLLVLAYTAIVHHGLGAAAGGFAFEWWHPTHFMGSWDSVLALEEVPARGVFAFALPALLLTACVFWGTGSSTARWLAVSCVVSVMLFAFYGLSARRAWLFFHWRGSLVMLMIGAFVGGALTSPLLTASWLRRSVPIQLLLYLPVLLSTVALLRHATGTDESLPFIFSPWPAVSIFGLEIADYVIVGGLLGLGLIVSAGAVWKRSTPAGIALAIAGLGLPAVWIIGRFGSLPPGGPVVLVPLMVLLGAACLVTRGGDRQGVLARRARHLLLGAALVYLPLFAGRALATGDYTASRFVQAQTVIDALAVHYEAEEVYPDELEELIAKGYLDSIPQPRVGFGIVYTLGLVEPYDFHYQSLGSSYVLEFVSIEWIQCAYSPPYEDDEEYEEEDEEFEEFETWSCPEARPELW